MYIFHCYLVAYRCLFLTMWGERVAFLIGEDRLFAINTPLRLRCSYIKGLSGRSEFLSRVENGPVPRMIVTTKPSEVCRDCPG